MNVKVKPLNKGEIYCCSLKKAKEIFRESSVRLNFVNAGNEFKKGYEHPVYHYAKREVKGKVIAYGTVSLREESPLFNFFELKELEYSKNLQQEFDEKYLPEFYRLYSTFLNDQSLTSKTKLILIEFIDGKLKLHETTLRF